MVAPVRNYPEHPAPQTGRIEGREAAVVSHDITVKSASSSPTNVRKMGQMRRTAQLNGMPLVLLEADRSDNDRGAAKAYDWDELKPLFNGGTLGVTGVKTAGNETYEPPFRGTIVISQNTIDCVESVRPRMRTVMAESA